MSLDDALDNLLEPIEQGQPALAPRRDRQTTWRPGVAWSGDDGTMTTDPMVGDRQPEWDETLRVWDLDPEKFAVVEPVLFNAWDVLGPEGRVIRMRQWKARVIRRQPTVPGVDWDRLLTEIRKYKPSPKPAIEGDGVFHVVLGDWQIAKPDGDGLRGTVERIITAISDVERRVKELRKIGRPLGTLFVEWTGDSIEGCIGHYDTQTFGVELDRRQQVQVARRLLRDALVRWSRLFGRVVVLAVAGNHGENRLGSKAFTTLGDNDDLAIVEQVAEILAMNREAFGHVEFALAEDHFTVTRQAGPWIVGVTHGHVAKESGTAEQKLRRWYERQAGGKRPAGDVDILVTGHYHHLRIADWGGCVWVQCPAMDGGSEWWTAARGENSQPGVLTFASYPNRRLSDVAVL